MVFCDSDTIGVVNMFGEFLLWDIRSNSNKSSYKCKIGSNYGSLHSVSVDPIKNDKFIGGTQSGHVCVWDLRKNSKESQSQSQSQAQASQLLMRDSNPFESFLAHRADTIVTDLAFANGFIINDKNRNEQNILSCGNDGSIFLWKLSEKQNDHSLLHSSGTSAITQMHFNQNLNVVAACSDKPCLVIAELD